jgi:hypothetical protein
MSLSEFLLRVTQLVLGYVIIHACVINEFQMNRNYSYYRSELLSVGLVYEILYN